MIHLADEVDYQATVKPDTWRVLMELARKFKERKLRVTYFNSTPQGGGGNEPMYKGEMVELD